MALKDGVAAVADILRRKLARDSRQRWNRLGSRLKLGTRQGFEVQGDLMERHKLAGCYLTLEQIARWAEKLSDPAEELYFYCPEAKSGYVHAVKVSRAPAGAEQYALEILPATSEGGVFAKTVAANSLVSELAAVVTTLDAFEQNSEGFEYRPW